MFAGRKAVTILQALLVCILSAGAACAASVRHELPRDVVFALPVLLPGTPLLPHGLHRETRMPSPAYHPVQHMLVQRPDGLGPSAGMGRLRFAVQRALVMSGTLDFHVDHLSPGFGLGDLGTIVVPRVHPRILGGDAIARLIDQGATALGLDALRPVPALMPMQPGLAGPPRKLPRRLPPSGGPRDVGAPPGGGLPDVVPPNAMALIEPLKIAPLPPHGLLVLRGIQPAAAATSVIPAPPALLLLGSALLAGAALPPIRRRRRRRAGPAPA